jgi:uncharacterized protein
MDGMKPSMALQLHRDAIKRIAESHHTHNVRVFGSALRGEDTESSDLDLLVDSDPDLTSLFDLVRLELALEKLLGVRVQVVTPGDLHKRFRERIVHEAQAL